MLDRETVIKEVLTKEEQVNSVVHYVEFKANILLGFREELYNDGWYMIGSGHFSEVYANNDYPDLVVKLNFRRGDSWPFYAKFCKDNENNPSVNKFIPVIHKFHKLQDRELYVAVLDKYESVTPEENLHEELGNCPFSQKCSIDDIADIKVAFYGEFITPYIGAFADIGGNDLTDDVLKRNSELYQASCIIFNELEDYCEVDVHLDNFMLDSNGVVIITDPVSFTSRSTKDIKAM